MVFTIQQTPITLLLPTLVIPIAAMFSLYDVVPVVVPIIPAKTHPTPSIKIPLWSRKGLVFMDYLNKCHIPGASPTLLGFKLFLRFKFYNSGIFIFVTSEHRIKC